MPFGPARQSRQDRFGQVAQRALITECHRVSGPWDRNNTPTGVVRGYRKWWVRLSDRSFFGNRFEAGVVGGYRQWRNQLGGYSIVGGCFQPCAGLVAGFVEVELRGEDACGPARVLSRLLVEAVRGRSRPW